MNREHITLVTETENNILSAQLWSFLQDQKKQTNNFIMSDQEDQ